MVSTILTVDDMVVVTKKDGSVFIGVIVEVSTTSIMDDIWYCIEPLDEDHRGDETNLYWVHYETVEKIL